MIANQKIAKIFYEIADLLDIKGVAFKPAAYMRAAKSLEESNEDVSIVLKEKGIAGLKKIKGIGDSMAQKIKEYLEKGKIKYYKELKDETAIQQIVTYFFESKGVSLVELKQSARKRKIVYSRFTKPAKQLLELAGSMEKAKEAIDKVSKWASSRNLDYAIETVFKKWLELDTLKPKEIVKKAYYQGNPMFWSETKKKWYIIKDGEWFEFADKEDKIEWRVKK